MNVADILRVVVVIAAVQGAALPAFADCADPFGDPDDVLTLTLRMTRADWDRVRLGAPVGEGCEAQHAFVRAQMRCGDDEPLSIGVRRKRGDQRGRDTDQKPPLKLDIDRFVDGQGWPAAMGKRGFRRLSLNNGQADNPGGLLTVIGTEHFAWRLMSRELAVSPRVAYARVFVEIIDDPAAPPAREPHGLYILIEDIDRTALAARFPSARGTLLKTTSTACKDEIVFSRSGERNATTDAYESWAAADARSAPAGAWRDATERALALDDLLRQEALRDVLGNREDTPLGNGSNHFAFDPDRDARRRYLPWDLDDAFRPDVAPDEPLTPACSFLGERTRCHPDIEPRYLEIVCQLVNGTLAPELLLADWDALDALVRPLLAEETQAVWRGRDPLDARAPRTYGSEVERVRSFIEPRIAAVRAEVEARGVVCSDTCVVGTAERCERLGCPGVRACVDGRFTACEVFIDETCNGEDDDCDLLVDEGACAPAAPGAVAAAVPPPAPAPASRCACSGVGASGSRAWAWALALGAASVIARRAPRTNARRRGAR